MALFGILVLLLSIMLMFIPLFGGYFTLVPGLMTLFVGRAGALYALIGVAINGVHLLFMSDFMRFNAASGVRDGIYRPVLLYVGLVFLQVAAATWIGYRHFTATGGSRRDSR